MEPITLRLSSDLISELDAEATEVGFSSRSEYIRYLLRNRTQTHTPSPSDTGPNTIEYGRLSEVKAAIETVETELSNLELRVSTLEEDPEPQHSEEPSKITEGRSVPLESFASSEPGSGAVDTDGAIDAFAALERWLWTNGPTSGNAREVMLEAARLLDDRGPLEAAEIRSELWERFPESYDSAETLWASTVQRLHEETPGFERPERGVYAFDRHAINR